jgi:hypothetical protein
MISAMSDRETPDDKTAHDVLAAEAFALPAPDPTLRHVPIALPDDPTGIAEAHDILAAEEFAMPAPRGIAQSGGGALAAAREASSPLRLGLLGVAAALVALLLLRRRRSAS